MLRLFVYVLGFTAYLLGCGSDTRQAGASTGRPDAEMRAVDAAAQTLADGGRHQNERDAGHDVDDGHGRPPCDVMRCERQADDLAKMLETPAIAISVKGGDCARVDIVGVVTGMACTCLTSNGWLYIGPRGAGCYARGRAGDCLWDDTEFETCSMGDPACPAMCEELAQRYAADAAKSFDVEVRYSTCEDSSCHYVLRIEDVCYADRSFDSGRRFSCELSDSEILEREIKAQKSH
ncbi:MAG TPA: hypothetical protein VFN67_20190 [Polyangiales bacterium]|nr:hypothetical protein [Polyangiales bacterium]